MEISTLASLYKLIKLLNLRVFYLYTLIKVGADLCAPKKFDCTCVPSHFFAFYLYALLDGMEGNGW